MTGVLMIYFGCSCRRRSPAARTVARIACGVALRARTAPSLCSVEVETQMHDKRKA